MMRRVYSVLGFLVCCACSAQLIAGELSDRIDVGDYAPGYASTKCGGVDDGVSVGKTTCYTCRAGAEPVFYVFVKGEKPGAGVVTLLKEVDTLVGSKAKEKVVGVVNFVGDAKDEDLRKRLSQFGKQHQLDHVAITVTADGSKFDLDEEADVTVMMYEDGIIRLRTSAKSKQVNKKSIETLMRRSKALIK